MKTKSRQWAEKNGFKVNKKGFIEIENREVSFGADALTWVRCYNDGIILKRAAGELSPDYDYELNEFMSLFGMDFNIVEPGSYVTLQVPEE